MRKFEILPHTADLRLKVEGDSLPELFLAAVEGMGKVIGGRSWIKTNKDSVIKELVVKEINVSSADTTALLVDFLSEVLTASHENKAIFYKAEFKDFNISSLNANLFGQKVDEFDEDIKAVTYHEANIIKNAQGNYETTIVFDI